MSSRPLYACLLRLHPRNFRRQFAEEMLWIFDETAQRRSVASLFVDALKSLFRQWLLRPAPAPEAAAPQMTDGAPLFQTIDSDLPRISALVNGGLVSVFAFAAVWYAASHGGGNWKSAVQLFSSIAARNATAPEEDVYLPNEALPVVHPAPIPAPPVPAARQVRPGARPVVPPLANPPPAQPRRPLLGVSPGKASAFGPVAVTDVALRPTSWARTLRVDGERLRKDALDAPLPAYPRSALQAGRQGIVVAEITVLSKGKVRDLRIVRSFDQDASKAITEALRQWRFVSIEKEPPGVRECPRIAQLSFRFSIHEGKGSVADLDAAGLPKDYHPGSLWPSLSGR